MSVRAEVRATYSYFIAFGFEVSFAFDLRVLITFPFVVYSYSFSFGILSCNLIKLMDVILCFFH